MSDRNEVTVYIFGKNYTMLTDEPAEQTEKIAAALNDRMKKLRDQKSSLSIQDAAAIIALECMEQLVNTKQTEQNIRTQISAYAEEAELCRSETEKLRKEVERLKEQIKQLEEERQSLGLFGSDESTAEQVVNAGASRAFNAPPKSSPSPSVYQPVPIPPRSHGTGGGHNNGSGNNPRR